MKHKLLTTLFFFVFSNSIVFGQFPLPSVSTQSPNAASLGIFGEIPVSLYTGVPQIGVPLHTLEEGKISVPISLNYHASGVRPNQHPGWVGMGWNLSAGGAITRKVKDLRDEWFAGNNLPFFGLFYPQASNLLNPSNSNPDYWESSAYLANLTSGSGVTSNAQDTEPDEFSFNFLGFSGSFYFDAVTRTFKVDSEHQFKVEVAILDTANLACPSFATEYVMFNPIQNGAEFKTFDCAKNNMPFRNGSQAPTVKQIKLTDLNGVSYIFGGDESAIEFGLNFFQQYNTDWIANAWYLKKIETLEGRNITFNYDSGNNSDIQDGFPFLLNLNYAYHQEDLNIIGGGRLDPSCYGYSYRESPFLISGDLVRPVYLKEIIVSSDNTANNQKIVFEKSLSNELKFPLRIFNEFKSEIDTRVGFYRADRDYFPYLSVPGETIAGLDHYTNRLKWYKLDRLKVYNQNQELITQYDLNYNNSSSERLFLNGLSRKDNDSQLRQSHTFSYFDRTLLPEYFHVDDKTDHWGYLNEGIGGPVRAIAGYTNEALYFNKKQPTTNVTLAKAGTLSSIVFPTGGSTSFDFGLNSYAKVVSPERNVFEPSVTPSTTGGLRVKQSVACESPNGINCITKEYYYVEGYTHNISNPTMLPSSGILNGFPKYGWSYNYTAPDFNVHTNVFSINNLLPSSHNINGSPIGYSEVVEKTIGNGYTIYKFTNFGTDGGQHFDEKVPAASRLNLASVRTIYEPFNDKSFERGKLRNVDVFTNLGLRVSSKAITYSKINDSFIRGIKASATLFCNTANNLPIGTAYKIYKTLYLPTEVVNVVYSTDGTNNGVTQAINYQYNTLGLQRSIRSSQSDGSTLVTRKLYVGDLNTTSITSSSAEDARALKGMFDSNMKATVVEQLTWKVISSQFENRILSGGINFFKRYGNSYQVKESYEMPIPVDLSDIPPANRTFETFPYGSISSNGIFNFYSKHKELPAVFKFDEINGYDSKGNVVQYAGRDQVALTNIWGYKNTYPVASIKGATYQDVINALGYSPNENVTFQSKMSLSDIQPLLSTLRSNLNNIKPIAQMTSRTYLSGIGIDSETSPNNIVTNYSYDGFNRLKSIKDWNGKLIKSYQYQLR
jgi:hypothetical protein